MNHFKSLLYILILFSSATLKAEETIYFPYKNGSSVGSVVATGKYTDLRADLDSDGKIDYWLLKKDNVSVEQFYVGGRVSEIRIKKIFEKSIREILYVREGNALILKTAVDRFPEIFGYGSILLEDKKLDVCEKQKSVFAELGKLGSDLGQEVCIENLDKKGIIDPSCNGENAVISKEQYRSLIRGLASSLDVSKENDFLTCLGKSKTAEIIGKNTSKDQKEQISQELKLIELKYKLYSANFYKNPDSLKNKIVCKVSPTKLPVAQTIESKNIIFYKQDSTDGESYKKVVQHEILHDIGLTNERSTQALIDVCIDKKSSVSKDYSTYIQTKKRDETSFANLNNAAAASKAQAQSTAAKVPKQLAETAIQNPPVAQLNQPFTESKQAVAEAAQAPEAAATKALDRSVSQSRGVFSTANNLLNTFGGAPKAVAAETVASSGLGDSSSESSSSSRSPASTKSASSSRKSSKDNDYKVVEEILVDQPTANNGGQAKAAARGAQSDFNPETGTAAAKTKEANTRETASGGGGSASGSSSGTDNGFRPASQGSGGGGSASSGGSGGSRSPASETQRKGNTSANSLVTMNRQEIIGALTTRSSYSSIKKQLTQSDVQQKLRSNGISIFDTKGNVIGAPKGQTILLDSGDAFVRQK